MIDKIIEDALEKSAFPGIVLSVSKNGRNVLSRAAGYRSIYPEGEKIDRNTLFDLASLTKPLASTVTALAVMEKEKINADAQAGTFLAEINDNLKPLTLKQLFTHTSGLPPVPEIFRLFPTEDDIDREKALKHLFSLELQAEPASEVIYSCTGYILLTLIIEKITGTSIDRLFSELVTGPGNIAPLLFNPLENGTREVQSNIAATEYCPWRKRWLKGEVHDENSFCLGGAGGNAGLFGTADSVLELSGLFMEEGYLNGKKILSPESVRLMTESQSGDLHPGRAFGFLVQDKDSFAGEGFSQHAFGHTGFTGTSLWIDPERGLSIALMTNRVHYGRDNTLEKIRSFRKEIHSALLKEFG